ncbi:oligosaccharide flippase family protein [Planctomycetota bacterium]|nr:oligosaccharide flippase family protein [Planctomycetota bacterium]
MRGLLRRSFVLGSTGIATSIVNIVRSKLAAVLLGPEGTGLIGQLSSCQSLLATITQVGIQGSGVQHIAQSLNRPGEESEYRAAADRVRLVARVSALAGFLGAILLCQPLARFALGSQQDWVLTLGLAPVVAIQALSLYYTCTLEGTRSISAIARLRILTALSSLAIAGLIFFSAGIHGALPYLAGLALANYALSRFLSREIAPTINSEKRLPGRLKSTTPIIGLGFAIMISGFATQASLFASRSIIVQELGLDGAGLYGAALSITGTVISMTTLAVSTEFYPSLCSNYTNPALRRTTIEQQVQLLNVVLVPAALALYTVPDLAVRLLFSSEYFGAIRIVQLSAFHCLGFCIFGALQYVLIAGQARRAHVITAILAAALDFLAIAYCTRSWGLDGLGYGVAIASLLKATIYFLATRIKAKIGLSLNVIAPPLMVGITLLAVNLQGPDILQTLPIAARIAMATTTLLVSGAYVWFRTKIVGTKRD